MERFFGSPSPEKNLPIFRAASVADLAFGRDLLLPQNDWKRLIAPVFDSGADCLVYLRNTHAKLTGYSPKGVKLLLEDNTGSVDLKADLHMSVTSLDVKFDYEWSRFCDWLISANYTYGHGETYWLNSFAPVGVTTRNNLINSLREHKPAA